MYKLSFLLHSLLDNGARMTPKRRSDFSLIFIVNCFSKFNLIIVIIIIIIIIIITIIIIIIIIYNL